MSQLAFYHSTLLVYKVKQSRSPRYLDNMFSWSYQYTTRQAESGLIKLKGRPRLDITRNSFRWRAAEQFNSLPEIIRNSTRIFTFKKEAKKWISQNIPIQ